MSHALVLGATSDIAVHICRELAASGVNLLLAGKDRKRLSQLSAVLKSTYAVEVKSSIFDATKLASHKGFYKSLRNPPDMVICCFGFFNLENDPMETSETARIISINFLGAASVLNLAAADFEKRKAGRIAALSSVAGDRGRQNNFIYGSAKAGLNAYLSGLRNRLHKSGVTVTTVKLGPVFTRMAKGQKLIPSLTASPELAAKKIVRAINNGKSIVYIKPVWRYIMLVIRLIPEWLFKRLPPF